MKITDKVTDQRLREVYASRAELADNAAQAIEAADADGDEARYDAADRARARSDAEIASIANELISARTALAMFMQDPAVRTARALDRIADRLDMFAGDLEPLHVTVER